MTLHSAGHIDYERTNSASRWRRLLRLLVWGFVTVAAAGILILALCASAKLLRYRHFQEFVQRYNGAVASQTWLSDDPSKVTAPDNFWEVRNSATNQGFAFLRSRELDSVFTGLIQGGQEFFVPSIAVDDEKMSARMHFCVVDVKQNAFEMRFVDVEYDKYHGQFQPSAGMNPTIAGNQTFSIQMRYSMGYSPPSYMGKLHSVRSTVTDVNTVVIYFDMDRGQSWFAYSRQTGKLVDSQIGAPVPQN